MHRHAVSQSTLLCVEVFSLHAMGAIREGALYLIENISPVDFCDKLRTVKIKLIRLLEETAFMLHLVDKSLFVYQLLVSISELDTDRSTIFKHQGGE